MIIKYLYCASEILFFLHNLHGPVPGSIPEYLTSIKANITLLGHIT